MSDQTTSEVAEFFEHENKKLPKNKRKRQRQQNQEQTFSLSLGLVNPKTKNQNIVFNSYQNKDKNVLLHGTAGTGKTFISIFLALDHILGGTGSEFKKLYIVRSLVPGRDSGFLPGNLKEKAKVYEAPYVTICSELFGRADAYDILKQKGIIEFVTTSYLRGTTFRDCIVLIDEFQNMNSQEMGTVITRMGENCRVLISGDTRQDDLTGKKREVSAGRDTIKIIERMDSFEVVRFEVDDIVRGDIVRQWIIAKEDLGID